ncbi:hypothetical protein [Deinococcus sp. SL84]|uniref:hypothetical protein n=1 Tax=Deinococcus sp. SL84 TaxID=2994663 RepID=UPI002273E52E|nr:hypothetical protein [Deinococcus sp. SL84]MCY1704296.1 hypothetical protein [Deinococcus sp. SL84]
MSKQFRVRQQTGSGIPVGETGPQGDEISKFDWHLQIIELEKKLDLVWGQYHAQTSSKGRKVTKRVIHAITLELDALKAKHRL